LKSVPQVQVARIENAGHMLQHDQPELLAHMLENFLTY
jgi:pimeloyl-ACP methyl ester carboxylesterase